MAQLLAAGRTCPGEWVNHPTQTGRQIYVQVSTGLDDLEYDPIYICAIAGDSQHWATTGGSSIYHPTTSGFRVNIRFAVEYPEGLTAELAKKLNWHVTWAAYKPSK